VPEATRLIGSSEPAAVSMVIVEPLGLEVALVDGDQERADGLARTDPTASPPAPYDMASGDINSLIKFRDANPATPIRAVFMVYNKPAFSIVGRKSRGVSKPKDLEAKTLGAPAPDGAYAQWKIFVQANGIDASKVKIENVGFPVREPMLQSGQVDAITGFSFSSFHQPQVHERAGRRHRRHADGRLRRQPVRQHHHREPEVCGRKAGRGEGLPARLRERAQGHRQGSVHRRDSVIKRNDVAKKRSSSNALNMALKDNIVTPEVKANGFGAVDKDRLAKAIDQIAITYEFKNGKPNATDAFDASFLPSAADRKAN